MTHQTTLTVVVVSSCGCGCHVDIVIVDEIKNWIGMDGPPKKKTIPQPETPIGNFTFTIQTEEQLQHSHRCR